MSDPQPNRKVRTRGHVIADLGVNHVERQVLLAGFTMERVAHDYGLDVHMTTFDAAGRVENETVWFQVKSTDGIALSADGQTAAVRVETADLRYWLLELMPVVLVLYDAVADRAFWVEVQEYARVHDLDADEAGDTVTIRLPTVAVFTPDAAREVRARKEAARAAYRRPDANN